MNQPAIDVRSEIGPLRRVLLHRPGRELENLMPEYIERLLFDDIPYLKIAQMCIRDRTRPSARTRPSPPGTWWTLTWWRSRPPT